MSIETLVNIRKFQKKYMEILSSNKSILEKDNFKLENICSLLDEIKFFWFERKEIAQFEVEEIASQKDCYLLSGAIYLNVARNEQFVFKSIGEVHFLNDPILKMENFFRVHSDTQIQTSLYEYFINVYKDTLLIFEEYNEHFFFIPTKELVFENSKQRKEFLDDSLLNFLSITFKKDFKDFDEFENTFNSYEEIEEEMIPFLRENLIFNNYSDNEKSLRIKIEEYNEMYSEFVQIPKDLREPQIFLNSISTKIYQITDILYQSFGLNLVPFIRDDMTFHYFFLLKDSFTNDEFYKKIIEKSIIFHIFSRSVGTDYYQGKDFLQYLHKLSERDFLGSILKEFEEKEINILETSVGKLEEIISSIFHKIIKQS